MTVKRNLITLDEWRDMEPQAQGYVLYMQACLPGSELKSVECPYEIGTDEREQWDKGEMQAVLLAQDSDD